MSHYQVLVIGENPEEQLKPYDENIELPEYKTELVSEEEKKSFLDVYTKSKKGRDYGAKNKKEEKENSKLSFEELYKAHGEDWNGRTWKKHSNGEWWGDSTYNPKSKWDWFEIGGRWAGSLKLKKDVKKSDYDEPNFSWGWDEKAKKEILKEGLVDSAKKEDIDFSMDKEVYKRSLRFWELKVEEKKPKNKKEEEMMEFSWDKKEYYIKKYKDKETYARLESSFSAYVVLKDGVWFESGQMGWFGCGGATPEEEGKFQEDFYDKFIKDLPNETLITIVDCHI